MALPDGEYEIDLQPRLADPLLQLRFLKDVLEAGEHPTFELYPRSELEPSLYLVATKEASSGKSLISEATAVRAKDSEYVLVLEGSTLKLRALGLIVRANKPRTTKKNLQELEALRDDTPTTAEPRASKSVPKPQSMDLDQQSVESEEFNFDDFDQFEVSPEIEPEKTEPEKPKPVEEDEDLAFDDVVSELDNQLDQVLGGEAGDSDFMSDFDIQDDEDNKVIKENKGGAPMSLKDLMGGGAGDESESEEE